MKNNGLGKNHSCPYRYTRPSVLLKDWRNP